MSIIYDALKKIKPKRDGAKDYLGEPPRQEPPRIHLIGTILVVALVSIFLTILFNKATTEKPLVVDAKKDKTEPQASLPTSTPPLQLSVQEEKTQTKETLAIPATEKGLFTQIEEGSGFYVTGIFYSDNQFFALVNNQMVKVGDSVRGAHIDNIDFTGVDITFEGSTSRLDYP